DCIVSLNPPEAHVIASISVKMGAFENESRKRSLLPCSSVRCCIDLRVLGRCPSLSPVSGLSVE
ncbi:hypothetical protein CEXT_222661, partial [Caerostris extrusa]